MLHIKINSKWIKNVDIRPKTIKLSEEDIGGKLHDMESAMISWI